MALANVALTDTFDTWRIRTNQLIVAADQSSSAIVTAFLASDTANAAFSKSNSANVLAFTSFNHANVAFDKANSALPQTGGTVTGNIAFTGHTISFTSNVASQVLTDNTTINWNLSDGTVATVTLGGNRTLANTTNKRVGTYILHIYQDGTGNRTLSYGTEYKWPAGVAPVLTTSTNSHDMISFVCDGTFMYGSFLPDVK